MNIDRNRFLALALGMGLGACGGGGGAAKTSGMPSNTADDPMVATPAAKDTSDPNCNGYDPTSECVSWNDGTVLDGYSPTGECMRWDPTNECTAWIYNAGPTGEGGPGGAVY